MWVLKAFLELLKPSAVSKDQIKGSTSMAKRHAKFHLIPQTVKNRKHKGQFQISSPCMSMLTRRKNLNTSSPAQY